MKAAPLLAWGAQVVAHAAYVEAHPTALRDDPMRRRATKAGSGRRSTAQADRNRAALLLALQDGGKHPFADLSAALPHLTKNGIYYLVAVLKEEGQIDSETLHGPARVYFPTHPRRSS